MAIWAPIWIDMGVRASTAASTLACLKQLYAQGVEYLPGLGVCQDRIVQIEVIVHFKRVRDIFVHVVERIHGQNGPIFREKSSFYPHQEKNWLVASGITATRAFAPWRRCSDSRTFFHRLM